MLMMLGNFVVMKLRHYPLGKGGYVFGGLVSFLCEFVCLSVSNITQSDTNRL